MSIVIDGELLSKTYPGSPEVVALRSASLRVAAGERLAVHGPSGSGKSTLLNILGLLDVPTSGTYRLLGVDVTGMQERERNKMRRDVIGFVFQAYHVLGNRTVAENVMLKLTIAGTPGRDRREMAATALESVGLAHLRDSLAGNLSGGEKQRLALARAISVSPGLLLADEPTGNLDDRNAEAVLDLLSEMSRSGIAVVVITHDTRTAMWAHRVMHLEQGVLGAGERDVAESH